MRCPRPVVIDFETDGIQPRPAYPPKPCGVSIKYPGKKAKYYAFGHLTGPNEHTLKEAKGVLIQAYQWREGVLFQNGKFDLDVAEVHLGLAPPKWDQCHDTMFLLFLDDPHQIELGLKPSSERLLGLPREEQDTVVNWLVTNQPVAGVKISRSKQSPTYAMKYVPYCPANVVGPYCNSDVDRTEKLFKLLWPKIVERGMLRAYDRERELMPILLRMERAGLQVDLKRLRDDVKLYQATQVKLDAWLRKQLGVGPELNLDSGEQLMAALSKAGKVDPTKLRRTANGKAQSNKEAMSEAVKNKGLVGVLKYRAQLKTCLSTFMEPWLATAERSGGLIFTSWNQIKGDGIGTRTGRLSSTPNFQNIPKEFVPIFAHEKRGLSKCPLGVLPPLPRVRIYVIPFKGEIFVDRDWSQQEPRILAHFDGGALMQKYLDDPWTDFHDYAKAELEKMGKFYDRRPVKNTNLGLIYGMGVGKLAIRNDMSVEESSELKKAIMKLYPGLKAMYQDMKMRAANNIPVRTWGGREYFCEPPRLVDGRVRQFDYKLVNVLIQGSAADCTKEAIIRFDKVRKPAWRLVLNVHDQLTASVPVKDKVAAMLALKVQMESVEFDVPILSEGAVSDKSWEQLVPYDKKGVLV